MKRVKLLEAGSIPILKQEMNFRKTVNECAFDHATNGK